ncbi:hypothetical protein PVAG01_05964 [Phlyctema vagabunda]|uniref:Uncharacterized protein n=1 Tax=Phlyctema vagabunda TaxID=108571 RepID=A0ABR4PEU5_9HELO
MCYYDQYQFECGDYRWGSFRAHCTKEYRTGETCGMKLIMNTYPDPSNGKCKICTKLDTKWGRIRKEEDKIRRWEREGGRKSSIEKSKDDIFELQRQIQELEAQRSEKQRTLV